MAGKNEQTSQGGAEEGARVFGSTVASATGYTKEQFLTSEQYRAHRDILAALLIDGESYTKDQVTRTIDEHLKKEAK